MKSNNKISSSKNVPIGKVGTKQKKPKMTKEERKIKYTNLARERRQKQIYRKKHTNTICYNCRQRGHAVNQCPLIQGGNNSNDNYKYDAKSKQARSKEVVLSNNENKSICYKCGKNDHTLKMCPLITREEKEICKKGGGKFNYTKMKLPFATCFICHKVGHLSSQCSLNNHGIYVNNNIDGGGNGNKNGKMGCKFCGGLDHLFIHCPDKEKSRKDDTDNNDDDDDDSDGAGNVDEFLEEENSSDSKSKNKDEKKGQTDDHQIIKERQRKTVQF